MENIFKERNCLTQEEIKQYLQEQLSKDKHFEVENHLADCPFCSDAIEGFETVDNLEEVEELLGEIDDAFMEKIAPPPKLSPKKDLSFRLLFLRSAAAVLLLGIPLGIYLYWGESKDQRLFASYFEVQASGEDYTARSANRTALQEPFLKALELYDKEEFEQSLVLFR